MVTGVSLTYSSQGYTLRFLDNLGNFNRSLQDRMVNTFFTVYPQIVSTFNANAAKTVTFVVDPKYDGVAATWANATVRFDPGYLNERIYDDVDSITHEVKPFVDCFKQSRSETEWHRRNTAYST